MSSESVVSYVGNFEPVHSTECHLARTLEDDLGWKVLRLQENRHDADAIYKETLRSGARFLLYTRTWGFRGDGVAMLNNLHAQGIPSASYHLDLYWKIARQSTMHGDPFWSTKYCYTADGGSEYSFRLAGINHHWLPPGVFRQECYFADPDPRFTCDVAFVGAMDEYHPEWLPYRKELRAKLTQWYGDRFRNFPGRGQPSIRNHDLNRLYASVKVCVGDSLCPGFNHPRYWSDRLPETIGRGGFIIHPRIDGIEQEYGGHVELFDFNDWDALKSKIDYYLANEDERIRKRNAAHEFVKANHTYTNRLRAMLQHLGEREGWVDWPGKVGA